MPNRDGTGPMGRGPMTGSGMGRMRGLAMGPGGQCMCTNPKCGHVVTHGRGEPCYAIKCPKCGSPMVRKS